LRQVKCRVRAIGFKTGASALSKPNIRGRRKSEALLDKFS
jgi:hypothetical protein